MYVSPPPSFLETAFLPLTYSSVSGCLDRKTSFPLSASPQTSSPAPAHSARVALMTDLVYNSRKRGGDSADRYFKATEMIAGVKDMRFQAIMPDTLHWLGVQKIDNMISMVSPSLHSFTCIDNFISRAKADVQSDMKYNAIVDSGIPILKRYDIPDHLIPPVCPFCFHLLLFSLPLDPIPVTSTKVQRLSISSSRELMSRIHKWRSTPR